MKSAADWLADSSDDDEKSTLGRTVAPPSAPSDSTPKVVRRRTPDGSPMAPAPKPAAKVSDAEAARLQRQREAQELRERMAAALGKETVAAMDAKKEAEKVAPAAASTAAEPKKQSVQDKIKSVFDSFTSDDGSVAQHGHSGALPPPAPGTVRPLTDLGPAEDEVVIMVANRGTQTATEISCQTDPEPHTIGCPMCYKEYFGHDGGWHSYCGVPHDPSHGSFVPLHPASHGMRGMAATRGLRSSPMGVPQTVPMAVYRQQVDLVRQQLDAIIRRHNLPELPGVVA